MADLPIPQADQERIDGMVATYRHQLENLYRMAYMQGQIDADSDTLAKLKAKAA